MTTTMTTNTTKIRRRAHCLGCGMKVPVIFNKTTHLYACKAYPFDACHVIDEDMAITKAVEARKKLPRGICFFHGWVHAAAHADATMTWSNGKPVEVCEKCGQSFQFMDRDVR